MKLQHPEPLDSIRVQDKKTASKVARLGGDLLLFSTVDILDVRSNMFP